MGSHMLGVAATLQHEMQKHARILQGVLTHSERKAASAFIQAPEDYFDASPTFKQSYAPQSGEIFGILRQMKETFEANLSDAQKEEIADTRNSLAADEKFLMMLKEKCQMTDKEWEERQKTRQLEMEAVSKALAILSGDDAHDLFTRTFNPALLQEESSVQSARRIQASSVLKAIADKHNNPRLATLAYKVRLDAFTRVKKAIDDMIAQLLKEKEDEIKHKDFCVD